MNGRKRADALLVLLSAIADRDAIDESAVAVAAELDRIPALEKTIADYEAQLRAMREAAIEACSARELLDIILEGCQ